MTVRVDCRHYLSRSAAAGDAVQRCRISANEEEPFACPSGCLFFEERAVSGAGWAVPEDTRMSNTADLLNALPPPGKRKKPKRR